MALYEAEKSQLFNNVKLKSPIKIIVIIQSNLEYFL